MKNLLGIFLILSVFLNSVKGDFTEISMPNVPPPLNEWIRVGEQGSNLFYGYLVDSKMIVWNKAGQISSVSLPNLRYSNTETSFEIIGDKLVTGGYNVSNNGVSNYIQEYTLSGSSNNMPTSAVLSYENLFNPDGRWVRILKTSKGGLFCVSYSQSAGRYNNGIAYRNPNGQWKFYQMVYDNGSGIPSLNFQSAEGNDGNLYVFIIRDSSGAIALARWKELNGELVFVDFRYDFLDNQCNSIGTKVVCRDGYMAPEVEFPAGFRLANDLVHNEFLLAYQASSFSKFGCDFRVALPVVTRISTFPQPPDATDVSYNVIGQNIFMSFKGQTNVPYVVRTSIDQTNWIEIPELFYRLRDIILVNTNGTNIIAQNPFWSNGTNPPNIYVEVKARTYKRELIALLTNDFVERVISSFPVIPRQNGFLVFVEDERSHCSDLPLFFRDYNYSLSDFTSTNRTLVDYSLKAWGHRNDIPYGIIVRSNTVYIKNFSPEQSNNLADNAPIATRIDGLHASYFQKNFSYKIGVWYNPTNVTFYDFPSSIYQSSIRFYQTNVVLANIGKATQYTLEQNPRLVDSITFGDENSRIPITCSTKEGDVIVCGYRHNGNVDLDLARLSSSGNWWTGHFLLEASGIIPSITYDIVQGSDGLIWVFGGQDSSWRIWLARFSLNTDGSMTLVDYDGSFCQGQRDGIYGPWGEIPFPIVALDKYSGNIILTFENPQIRGDCDQGANKVAVIAVKPDKTKVPLGIPDVWVLNDFQRAPIAITEHGIIVGLYEINPNDCDNFYWRFAYFPRNQNKIIVGKTKLPTPPYNGLNANWSQDGWFDTSLKKTRWPFYDTITKSNKKGYSIISNPFNYDDNNVTNIFLKPVNGFTIYKRIPFGWDSMTYDVDFDGWENKELKMNLGEGFFIYCPTDYTNTFIGEALSLDTVIPSGYSLIGFPYPFNSAEGLPIGYGDTIFKWNDSLGYNGFSYDEDVPGWTPSKPSFNLGEGFWIYSNTNKLWKLFP